MRGPVEEPVEQDLTLSVSPSKCLHRRTETVFLSGSFPGLLLLGLDLQPQLSLRRPLMMGVVSPKCELRVGQAHGLEACPC